MLLLAWSAALPAAPQTSTTGAPKAGTAAKAAPKQAAPAKKTTAKKKVVVRPRYQQEPTPERYREIQQALADKAYLQGPPTGVWDSQSIDALKRFQGDQKIQATGKIDALSLIRLGLGPKRPSNSVNAPPTPPETTAQP